jgi:hypothetical protein
MNKYEIKATKDGKEVTFTMKHFGRFQNKCKTLVADGYEITSKQHKFFPNK